MQLNDNNKFEVNVEGNVKISAIGSWVLTSFRQSYLTSGPPLPHFSLSLLSLSLLSVLLCLSLFVLLTLSHLMHTPLHRRPISACWYVTTPGSAVVYHPVDPDPIHQPTPAPPQNFTCRVLNGLYIWEPMTFSTAGQYEFVAMFYNSVSTANGTIPFGVVQGECSVLHCLIVHTYFVCSLVPRLPDLFNVCTRKEGWDWPGDEAISCVHDQCDLWLHFS